MIRLINNSFSFVIKFKCIANATRNNWLQSTCIWGHAAVRGKSMLCIYLYAERDPLHMQMEAFSFSSRLYLRDPNRSEWTTDY